MALWQTIALLLEIVDINFFFSDDSVPKVTVPEQQSVVLADLSSLSPPLNMEEEILLSVNRVSVSISTESSTEITHYY